MPVAAKPVSIRTPSSTGIQSRATFDDDLSSNMSKGEEFALFGNYFDNDTRTVLMWMGLCHIEVAFYNIGIIKGGSGSSVKQKYIKVCPAQELPCLIHQQHTKIFGDLNVIVNYLCK